ncbi:MAG: monovalent cation/H+ antiporter subunit D family protein [Planctomycetota bacterium]|jgi:multicomponent Na+:H+ antiporter subunit D
MDVNLPVLPIVLPLVSAPLCLLMRKRALVMGFSITVLWIVFGLACALLGRVLTVEGGVESYALGGWAAPYGIEYRVDALSAFVVMFVSGLGAIVLSYAPRSIAAEIPADRRYLFCSAYLLCVTGLLGITITGDLFNLYVFLEISAISSYALISQGAGRRAIKAAFKYLVMGTVGATFIVIGIGLLFMMTGTLNMVDMAGRIGEMESQRTVLVAAAFLTVGIFIKMAVFPLHSWLPDAYTYAPSVVTAFLAATSTKVSVYIFLRWIFTIFGFGFEFFGSILDAVLLPLALLGIFVASTISIFQTNLKRLLAFSSLAQVGYMILGVALANESGLTGGIAHMFNHAITKGGMFLAVGCMALCVRSVRLDDLRGLGKRMPVTSFLFTLGGLGLIGVPGTAGFISKLYLIRGALERPGYWPVAALALLSSLLAVVYVWRFVETAYLTPPPDDAPPIREAPLSMLIPTAVMIGATVYFGLHTADSAEVARTAAALLLGGGR